MLTQENGIEVKFVCPECGGDNIGVSGLGDKYLHCFGHCMKDIPRSECSTAPILPAHFPALRQEAY